MLSQTKEQIQLLINKVQVIDFVLNTLNLNHKDYADKIEILYKQGSNHKLKLLEEILVLSKAGSVEEGVPGSIIGSTILQ